MSYYNNFPPLHARNLNIGFDVGEISPMNRRYYAFYASAFRHYVFGLSVRLSVRPSVRSLKYPLLTCTWVRWSTQPTVTVLRHVRPSALCFPSVRPSVRRGFRAFAGERMEGMAWNFTCWCILTVFRTDEVTPVAGGLTLHSCYCN